MARAKLLLQEIETYAQNIGDTIHTPLIILDSELVVKSTNHSLYEAFWVMPENTEDCPVAELGNGQWNIALRLTMTHEFPKIGLCSMLLNIRKLHRPGNRTVLLVPVMGISSGAENTRKRKIFLWTRPTKPCRLSSATKLMGQLCCA